MHGLINLAIEDFLRDTGGEAVWRRIAAELNIEEGGFEAMLSYEPALTRRLVETAARVLALPVDDMLEDLGTYLVSHPRLGVLRRLLRFNGDTLPDFLHGLDDLPDQARLAVDDLVLPALRLQQPAPRHYTLLVRNDIPGMEGFAAVMTGLIRAMADDYGCLAVIERGGLATHWAPIDIRLLDPTHADARVFQLGGG